MWDEFTVRNDVKAHDIGWKKVTFDTFNLIEWPKATVFKPPINIKVTACIQSRNKRMRQSIEAFIIHFSHCIRFSAKKDSIDFKVFFILSFSRFFSSYHSEGCRFAEKIRIIRFKKWLHFCMVELKWHQEKRASQRAMCPDIVTTIHFTKWKCCTSENCMTKLCNNIKCYIPKALPTI